jgi:hypothetical protein
VVVGAKGRCATLTTLFGWPQEAGTPAFVEFERTNVDLRYQRESLGIDTGQTPAPLPPTARSLERCTLIR